MAESRSRARRRYARTMALRAEFERVRSNPEAFAALLKRLSDSNIPIWPLANASDRNRRLSGGERAMIAQFVAPRLAGMTPDSVKRRQAKGERDDRYLKLRAGLQSPVSSPKAETGDRKEGRATP